MIVGVKWRVADAAPLLGAFAIQSTLSLPTGSPESGRGSGKAAVNVLAISSHRVGPVSLDVNAGYTRLAGESTSAPRDSTVWTAAAAFPDRRTRRLGGRALRLSGHERTAWATARRGGAHGAEPDGESEPGPRRRGDLRHRGIWRHGDLCGPDMEHRPHVAALPASLARAIPANVALSMGPSRGKMPAGGASMRHRVTAAFVITLGIGLAAAGWRSGPAAQAPAPLEWQDPGHRRREQGACPRHVHRAIPTRRSRGRASGTTSPYYQSLNGDWKFHWVPKPADRPVDFFRPGIRRRRVEDDPRAVELAVRGLRRPDLREHPVSRGASPIRRTSPPNNNPVGSYRRTFTVPAGLGRAARST